VRAFKSHTEAAQELNTTNVSINCLVKGIKSKGNGEIVKISQWKGWKIYVPENLEN
jgi:hypothetical protein